MNKRFVALYLLLLPALVFSQKNDPGYFQVVKHFYEQFALTFNPTEQPVFAHKKDGWHVQTIGPGQPNQVLSDQLFWSTTTRKWQPLQKFRRGDASKATLNTALFIVGANSEYTAYGYERCRYFGYAGWYDDMIRDFEKAPLTNDTLVEGLARAHDAIASRYMWFEKSLSSPNRLVPAPDEKVKQMILHFDKAIAYYKIIQKRNPNYGTLLGKSGMKLFNECFHAWLQLQMCQHEQEAQPYFDQCTLSYDDSLAAANMLHSVSPYGVLITQSDNDTYPLMYLQLKSKVRPDVAVINTSLLAQPLYIQWLSRKKIITFTTIADVYSKEQTQVAVYTPRKDATPLSLTKFVLSRDGWDKQQFSSAEGIQVYYTKDLYLPVLGGPDTIRIKLENYIGINDFMLMDIVQQYYATRPIHFTNPEAAYFKSYLTPAGTVHKLVWNKASYPVSNEYYLTEHYKPPFRDYKSPSAEYNAYVICHFDLYIPIIQDYLDKKDTVKANELITQCLAPFNKKMPFTGNAAPAVSALYQSHYVKEADEMVDVFVKTILQRCLQPTGNYMLYAQKGADMLLMVRNVMLIYNRNIDAIEKAIKTLSGR